MEIRSATVEDLKVLYSDDTDPEKAGQGLQCFPLIKQAAGSASLNYWMMQPASRLVLLVHT